MGHKANWSYHRCAGDVRTQEEMLRKCQCLAEKADYSALKAQILPRASRMCLATTSAAVRQAAFQALTYMAPRFDKEVATGLVPSESFFLHVGRRAEKAVRMKRHDADPGLLSVPEVTYPPATFEI